MLNTCANEEETPAGVSVKLRGEPDMEPGCVDEEEPGRESKVEEELVAGVDEGPGIAAGEAP